jgi:hypothetical protein
MVQRKELKCLSRQATAGIRLAPREYRSACIEDLNARVWDLPNPVPDHCIAYLKLSRWSEVQGEQIVMFDRDSKDQLSRKYLVGNFVSVLNGNR